MTGEKWLADARAERPGPGVGAVIAALLGEKIGMTRVHDQTGRVTPVTIVQAGPCVITQIKNTKRDGYDAVQLSYGDCQPHRATVPRIGHCAAAGAGPKRFSREIRLPGPTDRPLGDVQTVERFGDGAVRFVDVTGISKGKGFAGVMKRHGFGGQQATHGVERKHRSPGSIGGSASLGTGRGVRKGKKMAGHMGHVRITTRNQEVLGIDAQHNLLLIKGSVPGPNGGLVMIRESKTKA